AILLPVSRIRVQIRTAGEVRSRQALRTSLGDGTRGNRRHGPRCAKTAPPEATAEEKNDRLARFVPIFRDKELAKVYVQRHKLGSCTGESLFRGGLARVFPRRSRNSAPRERLQGAFAEVPLRTRC